MSRSARKVGDNSDHRHLRLIVRQRVEDLHLVGDRGDVDDLRHVGMEAFERALRGFAVEGAGRDVMGGEVVEQRARHRGLADAAFVRADDDN
jgi:hypothetical protein